MNRAGDEGNDGMRQGWLERFYAILSLDEGVRDKPYDDTDGKEVILKSGGNVTIGVGRNLNGKPLSPAAVQFLFREDAFEALQIAQNIIGPPFDGWSDPRQLGFLSLCFNLGERKLRTFVTTLWAIQIGNWNHAGERLRKTLWYKQVGKRADRVILMLQDEKFHEDYKII